MTTLESLRNPKENLKLFQFTAGISWDSKMATEEIRVQQAWVTALTDAKILSHDEGESVKQVLAEACTLMLEHKFPWQTIDEDIHMNLERFVTTRLGEIGKRIHLGRSRNDLIATTMRLYVDRELRVIANKLLAVIRALCARARATIGIITPGMTHLQHAQPVRFGHIMAAHGWAFARDAERIVNAKQRCLSYMPLGSAALAGTTLKIDLETLAERLGFIEPSFNSYDAVSDRDFLVEALHAISLLGVHMSRLAEDLIIWSSTPVGLIKLPPLWSTGSSIMPNKRNPDVPELIRAKSAHLMAATTNVQLILKGLPTSYDSDLHELKSITIRSLEEADTCLEVLAPFIEGIVINESRAAELLEQGHLLATEIANHLTEVGVSFREAYRQTAALVEAAIKEGVSVEKVSAAALTKIAPMLSAEVLRSFTAESSVEARNLIGGTSLKTACLGIEKLECSMKQIWQKYLS